MASMAAMLPEYRPPMPQLAMTLGQPRFPLVSPPPAPLVQQSQPYPQFAGQTAINDNNGYNLAFPMSYAPSYLPPGQPPTLAPLPHGPSHHTYHPRHGMPGSTQQPYPASSYFHPPFSSQPLMYYPPPYGQVNPSQAAFQGVYEVVSFLGHEARLIGCLPQALPAIWRVQSMGAPVALRMPNPDTLRQAVRRHTD